MELYESIYQRYSARKYEDRPVPADVLQRVIEAGSAAAVGKRRFDTLYLTVVESAEAWEAVRAPFGENDPTYGAPLLLILSARAQADRPGIEYANAACILENMMLAATAEGLGSCYIWGMLLQLKEDKVLCEKLGIPEGFVPASAVLLGYAADEPRPKTPEVKIGMNKV
ncbi:MAG: nitroreductase family protein [Ruminococcaceae bacterium]|nr:nitroreductase family protein [Oscillospiraceae bacterium]